VRCLFPDFLNLKSPSELILLLFFQFEKNKINMKNNLTIFQAVNYFASSGVLLISITKSLVSIPSKAF
jgi:hypothetical protein